MPAKITRKRVNELGSSYQLALSQYGAGNYATDRALGVYQAAIERWERENPGQKWGALRSNPPVAIFANPTKGRIAKDSEHYRGERQAWESVRKNALLAKSEGFALGSQTRYRLNEIINQAEAMIRQLAAGIHANPDRIPLLGRDRGRLGGAKMSARVIAVEYKHKDDGRDYRHDFRPGVEMIAEADGNIRLQHAKPGYSLWEDM